MGIRLREITDLASNLVASGNKLLTSTTGNLTRLVSWSSFADWILKTYEGFTQSGSDATALAVSEVLDRFVMPEMFGTNTTPGTTDMATAIARANAAAVAQNKAVLFTSEYLVGSQIALTSSHNGLKWVFWGATIKKGFSGNLVANSGADGFSVDGVGTIDGQHGTYTGKGFVFTTSNSANPFFGPGITLTSFTDSHIEFGSQAGQNAKVMCDFRAGSGQTDFRAIHCTGTDTTACHRRFGPFTIPLGYIDLDGALSTTVVSGSIFRRVEIDDDCSVTIVCGCTWGNEGTALTISGGTSIINNNRIAAPVTLASGMSGSFVGNAQTTAGFTNSTTGGNVVVFHKDINDGTFYIGKSKLVAWPTGAERIVTSRTANVGDQNVTATVGSSAPVIIFNTTTSARTVTLSTTGAVTGDRFRVVNKGASDVDVGGLKTLSGGGNGWADVEYTGSAWVLTAAGTL